MRTGKTENTTLLKRIEITVILTMISLVAVFLFPGNIQHAHGEGEQHIALEVCYDDEVIKQFSMADLENIAKEEGGGTTPKSYTYSGYNTYPARNVFKSISGATVKGILDKALAGRSMSVDGLHEDQLIEFMSGGDGNKEYFLKSQLFADRYYFPDDDSKTGKVAVPAVISLTENGKPYGYGQGQSSDVGRLIFGQMELEEQNHAAFLKCMATTEHTGRITIYSQGNKPSSSWNDAWNPILTTDHGSGGKVEPETELTFDRSVNIFPRGGGPRYWIHYTIDGTEPDGDDEMYNWNNFNFGKPGEQFTKPVVGEGPITIKVKVIGYGKKDSEVTTFTFTGEETLPPAAPARVSGTATGYQSIRVSWNKVGDADGYQIFRSQAKSTGFTHIYTANIGSQVTFNNSSSSVKTGTTYYYRVRAFKVNNNGVTLYSGFSPVVSAKTYLNRPNIKSIKAKGKKITLRWTRVPGATGYKIYRATKKKGKYALIKTVRGNGKVSMVNKKLKKKKTYWYKVRAYRTVDGKNVYSSFSNIKYRKIR